MTPTNEPSLIETQLLRENNGSLLVLEHSTLPFSPRRTFCVDAPKGSVRGQHAHRTDSQVLVVVAGEVRIDTVSRHGTRLSYTLSSSEYALYLPPMVWAEQTYMSTRSILLVACAMDYDERDYIRDPNEFTNLTGVDLSHRLEEGQ